MTLHGSSRGHPGSRIQWGKPKQGGRKQGTHLGTERTWRVKPNVPWTAGEGGSSSLLQHKEPPGGASAGDACGQWGRLVFTPELRVGRSPPPCQA